MKGTFERHRSECAECREDADAASRLRALDAMFAAQAEPGDVERLSAAVLAAAAPVLQAAERKRFRRRVAAGLAAALVPAPFIFMYSKWLLGRLHDLLVALFAPGVADFVVGGYAACLLLVFSLTYAAIPILIDVESPGARRMRTPVPAP